LGAKGGRDFTGGGPSVRLIKEDQQRWRRFQNLRLLDTWEGLLIWERKKIGRAKAERLEVRIVG